jgi:putative FmdB family regulatory protein
MPLFEFVCESCGHRFEEIVSSSSTPHCPACDSAELRRLISGFAVGGSTRRAAAAPAAPIGGG